jgi:hypothetical protein
MRCPLSRLDDQSGVTGFAGNESIQRKKPPGVLVGLNEPSVTCWVGRQLHATAGTGQSASNFRISSMENLLLALAALVLVVAYKHLRRDLDSLDDKKTPRRKRKRKRGDKRPVS